MTKFTEQEYTKAAGGTLSHTEWNKAAQNINDLIDASGNAGGVSGGSSDSHVTFDSTGKHNLNIATTSADQYDDNGEAKGGKINIEPISDLQIKAGDDIILSAHHRAAGDNDKILLKVLTEATGVKKGNVVNDKEIPAKFKISSGDITITNKDNVVALLVEINTNYTKTKHDYDMTGDDFTEGTFLNGTIYEDSQITSKLTGKSFTEKSSGNSKTDSQVIADILGAGIGKNRKIRVLTSANPAVYTCYTFTKVSNADGVTNISIEDNDGYGYLKLRAQSIDVRCEEHGGIALQPKGEDNSHHMNKIKFEHGGGDGLEFGTFNTEHTSLFTEDYRFNKNGVVKLATRTTELSDKYDGSDETTHYKYVKNQNDDFYDNIDSNDPTCTWELIVNACGNTEPVTAYYIFQLTEELQNPNGPVYPGSVYGGEFVTLDGTAHAITQTPLTVNTQVENVTSGVSALKIDALETVQTDLVGYINSTKYLPSTEVETFFNLGTGAYNNNVYEFLYGTTSSGIKAFLVGNTVYGLVNPADVVDVKLKAPKESASIYLRDVIKLVDYFKNGAGKNDGPWAPVI